MSNSSTNKGIYSTSSYILYKLIEFEKRFNIRYSNEEESLPLVRHTWYSDALNSLNRLRNTFSGAAKVVLCGVDNLHVRLKFLPSERLGLKKKSHGCKSETYGELCSSSQPNWTYLAIGMAGVGHALPVVEEHFFLGQKGTSFS